MRASSLIVIAVLAVAAAAGCPRDTSSDKAADARVLFVFGTVDVAQQGAASSFHAAPGIDLKNSDMLTAAKGAFVIVQLRNGHVVRIDDAGALAVQDILLSNAPPTDLAGSEQLQALLEPSELHALSLQDVDERAAAWRQMRRAAESGGAERAPAKGDGARQVADEGAPPLASAAEPAAAPRDVASAPSPLAKSDAPPPREPESDAPGSASSRDLGGALGEAPAARGERAKKDAPVADQKTAPPEAKAGAPPPPPLTSAPHAAKLTAGVADAAGGGAPQPAGFVAELGSSTARTKPIAMPATLTYGELGPCLAQVPQMQPSLASVRLLLEVKGGAVVRVRLGGALPAPACARSYAGRPLVDVGDGWLVVTVPLGG